MENEAAVTVIPAEKQREPLTLAEGAYEWLQSIVIAWVVCLMVFTFVGRQIGVDGHSMQPTLNHGDRVIMSNLLYTPKYGDVVVVTQESFSDEPIVKRVIGTAGQTVEVDYTAATVIVDGNVLDEPYIFERMREPRSATAMEFPLTVPDGYILVMGDNRNHSTDGRDTRIGLVNTDSILGRVYLIIWPFRDFKFLKSLKPNEDLDNVVEFINEYGFG
jgi:signal peptidase I